MGLEDIFGSKDHITTGQECARALVVFAYGLVLVRVAGRRVFGKWSALDIVVSIIVGSNLSRALTGGADLVPTLAATTLLMAMHWVLARAAARWRTASRLVEGDPVMLGKAGRIDAGSRLYYAISDNDLAEAARGAGLEDLSRAKLVMLEPSGKISVLT